MFLKLKELEQTLRKAKKLGFECLVKINGEYYDLEE